MTSKRSRILKVSLLTTSGAIVGLALLSLFHSTERTASVDSNAIPSTSGTAPTAPAPLFNKVDESSMALSAGDVETPAWRSMVSVKLAAKLDKVEGIRDAGHQAGELRKLVNEIPIADIPTALEVARDRNTTFHGDYRQLLVSRWVENDPSTASHWVEQNFHFSATQRREALNAAAGTWARKDPAAAAEWASQLPDINEANGGVLAVAYEVAGDNPSAALALIEQLPASEARDDLMMHAAATWTSKAPEKALAWARALGDDDLRQRTTATIAVEWSESQPGAAATLAIESLPPGKAQDDAVVGIVQRWVQNEPEKAAAWVSAFPDGKLRNIALEAVVKLWADADLAKAGNWVGTISTDPGWDVAVGAYVEKTALQFPEVAAQWAMQIKDHAFRDQQMESLGELWLGSDPATARAWISQTSLPDATKSRLLTLP